MERRGLEKWLEPTVRHQSDLVFITAVWRLLFNVAVLLLSLELAEAISPTGAFRYGLTIVIGTLVTLVASVMLPSALTRHAGEVIVATAVRPLHTLRWIMWPITRLMHFLDRLVLRTVGAAAIPEDDRIEKMGLEITQEILSVMEEGEKEGLVDEEEREMIQSVISFRTTTAGQIMTPRPEIVAIEAASSLAEIKEVLEESGHSRIPVYDDSMDQIVGVLYARDLLKLLGEPMEKFNIRSAVRPAFYVPDTKPLRDVLHDFRAQKVHMAIVLDEYGTTSGVVTIEDVLEELVGDISDEHEPSEPAPLRKIDERSVDVDARFYVDELNRKTGLDLPEDAGYDTLGGFVSTTAGRILQKGQSITHDGATFTVLEAEPHRVTRVKIDLPLAPSPGDAAKAAPSPRAEPASSRG